MKHAVMSSHWNFPVGLEISPIACIIDVDVDLVLICP